MRWYRRLLGGKCPECGRRAWSRQGNAFICWGGWYKSSHIVPVAFVYPPTLKKLNGLQPKEGKLNVDGDTMSH